MTAREQLIAEIEAFLAKHRMSPTAFGRLVLNNKAFMIKFRGGADVRTETADKLRAFMASYNARPNPRKSPGNDRVAA